MMSANFLDNNNENYDFKKRQKNRQTMVIALSLVGVVVIVFGFWHIRNTIFSPFILDEAKLARIVDNEQALNDLSDLAAIDTDGDGLSDYDELYVYGTSPYLEDTDGDGLSDYDEIFIYQSDPLCPEGQTCSDQDNFAVDINTDLLFPSLNNDSGLEGFNEENLADGFNETELLNTLAAGIDAPTLRALLLENGVAQEVLDEISDEDLLLSYQEALNKQNEQ